VLSSSLLKSSQEKIVGIVDESGVIYDPSGLNKDILHKLIEKKQTIENYDGKLSKNGYLVKVGDENV
jgi:glutamate dehydrogenase